MSVDWSDLRPRVLSAVVMMVVGGVALWQGGAVFAELIVVVTGVMIWELAQMTGPNQRLSLGLGILASASLGLAFYLHAPWTLLGLVLPSVFGVLTPRRNKAVFAAYALVIMLCGLSLVVLRHSVGLGVVLWLLSVIVVSDVMGYFAGRILGGPKFWPRISPKKTWSGTVAGWIGAALVGFGFWQGGAGTANLIWFSPIVAFAGQLGDIAESAIKRRAGVKDSSNLIPGHGGVLDRFDAVSFAAILVGVPYFIALILAASQTLAN